MTLETGRIRTVIFLGAGASAAEGAPIQSALFRDFFSSTKETALGNPNLEQVRQALSEFFESAFGVRLNAAEPGDSLFPTFEEALGILDLSDQRNESLRFLGDGARGFDGSLMTGSRIRLLRFYLVLCMAKAIADALGQGNGGPSPHRMLAERLRAHKLIGGTAFVSTNYDLLIDNALFREFGTAAIDYGVTFNAPQSYLRRVGQHQGGRVQLLKVHGSLNWLHCPTCNSLKVFEFKVVEILLNDRDKARCDHCGFFMSPVIVPPTYYKDMSNVFLSLIWNKAENTLREAKHVIFCGYSFPDADMHIKYLLKRAQTNRPDPRSLKFTVINNHSKKTEEEKKAERERYRRFLGGVDYRESSFQDFASDPRKFYRV